MNRLCRWLAGLPVMGVALVGVGAFAATPEPPQLTSEQLKQIERWHPCISQEMKAARELDKQPEGRILIPGCGFVEKRFVNPAPDRAILSLVSGTAQTRVPYVETVSRGAFGEIHWRLTTEEPFAFDGRQVTWYRTPPRTRISAGWPYQAGLLSASAYMWGGGAWKGRAEASFIVKWVPFGWEIQTETIDHWINFYGSGAVDGGYSRY